jgi:hypothetical protein
MLLRRFRCLGDGKECHLTRSALQDGKRSLSPYISRFRATASAGPQCRSNSRCCEYFGTARAADKNYLDCCESFELSVSKEVHSDRSAYAVVIASTLSGSIRIPNTRTAEKTAVKTRISPSLTSRRSTKNSITIGTTGNTLEVTVIIPFAIHRCDESANEYT